MKQLCAFLNGLCLTHTVSMNSVVGGLITVHAFEVKSNMVFGLRYQMNVVVDRIHLQDVKQLRIEPKHE